MTLNQTPTVAMTHSPLLRAWCVVTCGAALITVLFGTLVTTFHVGMTDPLWPTAPWHLLLIERVPNFGFYVEHTHRIVGYLIGTCIIIQTVAFWRSSPSMARRAAAFALILLIGAAVAIGMRQVKLAEARSVAALGNSGFLAAAAFATLFLMLAIAEVNSRSAGRWQRLFASATYLGVVTQGLLGGLRVYLNELRGPELALVHGLLAQTVLALTVLLAVMTKWDWNSLTNLTVDLWLRRLVTWTFLILVVQIAFGGFLRHFSWPFAHRVHPMLAFAIALGAILILTRVLSLGSAVREFRHAAWVFGIMVLLQGALGVEAWLRHTSIEWKFQTVQITDAIVRSVHVLVGFAIFSTSAVLAARAWRSKLL